MIKFLAHKGVEVNGVADSFAMAAAENRYDAVDRQLQRQASLSHLIRVTTEARTQGTRACITSHVKTSRRYWPPKDSGICPDLRMERKEVASRFFQLASKHAAIDSYLAEKTKTI